MEKTPTLRPLHGRIPQRSRFRSPAAVLIYEQVMQGSVQLRWRDLGSIILVSRPLLVLSAAVIMENKKDPHVRESLQLVGGARLHRALKH